MIIMVLISPLRFISPIAACQGRELAVLPDVAASIAAMAHELRFFILSKAGVLPYGMLGFACKETRANPSGACKVSG